MQLDLGIAEYIGAREQQQDLATAHVFAGGALLVLADGLGGHESGAEASRIVVTTFKEAGAAGRFENPGTCRQALREVLDLANTRIAEGVDPSHGHRGMASTVVAAVVDNGDLRWVSVGDSHLYLWRDGRLHKLNEDHSQAGLMVRSGQYKPEDPEVLAVKSVLVSALTGRKLEIVDLPQSSFRLEPGDVLMLASDGLNTLADDEIERVVEDVRAHGAKKLAATLLKSVKSRRLERQDNTTVVVARVLEPARIAVPAAARRPEVATTEAFDDTSEERTQRITDEPERAEAPEVATKPVTRPAAPKAREISSSATTDPGPEASPSAPAPEASPVSEAAREARSPLLKPKSERPAPPRLADAPDGPESEPVALGAAPADVAPDVVPASRPRAVRLPEASVPRSSMVRSVLVLVLLLLLASGVAIAALKPDWLSSIVPGYGEANAPAPASKVEAVVEPKANAAAPELAKPPAPATKPTADAPPQATSAPEAPKAAPEASRAATSPPEAASTPSATPSASVTSEPSGKAQAAGEAAAPAASSTQSAPLPAASPPLVEPERPAARPGARGRTP